MEFNIIDKLTEYGRCDLTEHFTKTKASVTLPMNNLVVLNLENTPNVDITKDLIKVLHENLKRNYIYLFPKLKLDKADKIDFAKFLIDLNINNCTYETKITDEGEERLIIDLHFQLYTECLVKYITLMLDNIGLLKKYYDFKNVKQIIYDITLTDKEQRYSKQAQNKFYASFKNKTANTYLLKDLPKTSDEINNMPNQKVNVEGEIFLVEEKQIKTGYIYSIYITDYEESTVINVFSQQKNDSFKVGRIVNVEGVYEFDKYSQMPVINRPNFFEPTKKFENPYKVNKTNEEQTRVELHAHSTYSALDGLTSVKDYYSNAKKLGIEALAITDHENVQNFPDVEANSKNSEVKPIYSVELNMLDDDKYKIYYEGTSTKNHIVALDIETTGFSVLYDDLIQISAYKVINGKTYEFNKFVMPENIDKLSNTIINLTGITKEILLSEAVSQKEALEEFYNFIDDGIIVAHNARFDVEFLETKFKKYLNVKKYFTYIDTLNFARHCLKNEMSMFSLDKVSSKLKVKLDTHHRADSDSLACLGIYQALIDRLTIKKCELNELNDEEIYTVSIKIGAKKAYECIEKLLNEKNYAFISENLNENTDKKTINYRYTLSNLTKSDILDIENALISFKTSKILDISTKLNGELDLSKLNELIEKDEYLMDNKTIHITCLVKNEIGKKELYKLISLSHTKRITKRGAVILKSDLTKELRENVLIGSACVNGYFRQVYEKGPFAINPKFFDYFEIQPFRSYVTITDNNFEKENNIQKTVKYICNVANKLNKMVVATSDAHYLTLAQKSLRKIYTETMFGGTTHTLKGVGDIGDNQLMPTSEFLETITKNYPFLDSNYISQIVFDNPKKVANSIEQIQIVPSGLSTPKDDFFKEKSKEIVGHEVISCKEEMVNIVNDALKKYEIDGVLPEYIQKRVDKELKSIIGHGFYIIYYISYLLVKKSNDDGYVVGSRGSVGSSFVANLMKITEVNSLKPHYRCPKCHYQAYKGEKSLFLNLDDKHIFDNLAKVEDGFDLPACSCPNCNNDSLVRDGHDIPFETFLGFDGDKTPDIDLNFSGEYQSEAHNFCKTVFGSDNAYRAGTIATVADKTSQIYIEKYSTANNLNLSQAEIVRRGLLISNVKRTTGQHPSGIIIVPNDKTIYDFTPIQYPANKASDWCTTHFDYHAIHDNILKMDILGHDDPTMLKMLMNIVKENPDDYPFDCVEDIPVVDEKTFALLQKDKNDIIQALGISEFGTTFVINMLKEIGIKSFADLVKVSGLSHGTDVWANNNEELVLGNTKFGKIDFSNTIGCRDDIMVQMIDHNIDNKTAFDIMEFVRKGKVADNPDKWENYKKIMTEHNVPEWYIWSCEQIKYMFPKAHAVAYVMSALRIAWFKAHHPLDFYQAIFSIRADNFESISISTNNIENIQNKIEELKNGDCTANDLNSIHYMEMAIEMIEKGYRFEAPDVNKSHYNQFIKKDDKTLLMPLNALKGVGESTAIKVYQNRITPYISLEDLKARGGADKTMINALKVLGKLEF